jgi:hypothetical protein
MDVPPYRDEELASARLRFGRMVRAWMRSGGWTTKTPMLWAQAAGVPQISNNTMSFIWNGTQPKTSPGFFANLGYLNWRLSQKDYGPITSRDLRERITALEPLQDAKTGIWQAADFFACYIGQKDPPPEFDSGPPGKTKLLSPEVAQRISSEKRNAFEQHAKARGLSKAEAWTELKDHCTHLTTEQLDVLQQVLAGWHNWTPEELESLKMDDGHNAAMLGLQAWCGQELCAEFRELIRST